MDKKAKKRIEGKCHFCPCEAYECLSVHRILPGSKGGKYKDGNTVVVCENHHRLIHSEKIKILGRHYTTAGIYILHYLEDGEEKWG